MAMGRKKLQHWDEDQILDVGQESYHLPKKAIHKNHISLWEKNINKYPHIDLLLFPPSLGISYFSLLFVFFSSSVYFHLSVFRFIDIIFTPRAYRCKRVPLYVCLSRFLFKAVNLLSNSFLQFVLNWGALGFQLCCNWNYVPLWSNWTCSL